MIQVTALHYKTKASQVEVPWYGGDNLVLTEGWLTDDQVEALKAGQRVTSIDGSVEMWVS